MHYNINNNNNNNNNDDSGGGCDESGRRSASPKRFWNRWLKRSSPKKFPSDNEPVDHPYDFGGGGDSPVRPMSRPVKRVHWVDDDETILKLCYQFVDHLKLFVQHVINDYYDDEHWRQCQTYLNELHRLIDSSALQRAFDESLTLANEGDKVRLLRQQTFIAQLISRTVLSS